MLPAQQSAQAVVGGWKTSSIITGSTPISVTHHKPNLLGNTLVKLKSGSHIAPGPNEVVVRYGVPLPCC